MLEKLPLAGRPERKLFHVVAGSAIPLAAVVLPGLPMVPLLAGLSTLALATEGLRLAAPPVNHLLVRWFGRLLKPRETHRITGATWLSLAALFCFAVYPREVAILSLLFLAVGDPMATLVGRRALGPRVWGKSPVGTVAFFMGALAVGVVLVVAGVVPWRLGIPFGALVAALVELLPVPLDDNFTVPVVAGLAMTLAGLS